MRRLSRQAESDESPGAPEWIVTFSDCMTLLLTFFVLLLSFSSFDEKTFRKIKFFFLDALPEVSETTEQNKDAMLERREVGHTTDVKEGSEKPTLVTIELKDGSEEETESPDFHRLKTFSISSEKIFWGKGTLISAEGRRIMTQMASFLKGVPSRVVVSENGLPGEEDTEQLGLSRAWAVMEYLTTEQNLDKEWFSISAASTLAQESLRSGEPARAGMEPERTVEIVLLERSIYD